MIPTLNEESSIGNVLDTIPYAELNAMGLEVQTVVVDGRSSDRTPDIARDRNAKIYTQQGKGKGTAVCQVFGLSKPEVVVHRVLNLTTRVDSELRVLSTFLDSEYVIMLDGDGTYPPDHIVDMVQELESGYDAVLGSRFKGSIEGGAMSRLNWVGNRLLSAMATGLYFRNVSDLCTGMWGFRTPVLRYLTLTARTFDLEAEMFAELAKHHFKIKEVPIYYRCREGESKLVPLSAGLIIGMKLLERRLGFPTLSYGTPAIEGDVERSLGMGGLR